MSTKQTKKSSKAKQPKPKAKPATPKHQRPRPAEPVAAKPVPQPVTEAKPRRTTHKPLALTDVITAIKPCPYGARAGKAVANYNRYRVGMTVEAALKAGCPRDYIVWDRRFGYITVSPAN